MKTKLQKFLIIALSLELLFSSIGIAQVSHLCKMAMQGVEKSTCTPSKQEMHDCCKNYKKVDDKQSDSNSCCTNQVKYYNYKISGSNQNTYAYNSLQIAFIQIFFQLVSIPEYYSQSIRILEPEILQDESVQQKTLSISKLLI